MFLFHKKVGCLFSGTHNIIRPNNVVRLCIRDEFGVRALAKPAVTLKSTTLRREIKLRTTRRNIMWIYSVHKVHTWTEYNENEEIFALHRVLNNAIEKYRDHRMRAGLFYLAKDFDDCTFTVRSHLYGESDS